MTSVGPPYPHLANKCLLLKLTLTCSPSWSKPAVCWPLQLHNQRTRAECRGSEAWGFHVPITSHKWSWSCISYKIISQIKKCTPYWQRLIWGRSCGLFQVLLQRGWLKMQVGNEQDLGGERRRPSCFLSHTLLITHPLFQSFALSDQEPGTC